MKAIKYITFVCVAVTLAACSDINSQFPEGNEITSDMLNQTMEQQPTRIKALFNSMFSMMGEPDYTFKYGTSDYRADDFGFVASLLSNDVEGPDAWYPNSGYNWFSACGDYSSRNADYANPYNRYAAPYNQIGIANQVIVLSVASKDSITEAQARAVRAYDYLSLAPYFQFDVKKHADDLCVPIVTEETTAFDNNPRKTVKEVYDLIMSDLDYAVKVLTAANYEPTTKANIGAMAALGLRARANLILGNYQQAADDAQAVIDRAGAANVTPLSKEELLTPGFCDISSHNWIWGINVSLNQAQKGSYATAASWISSLSGDGYAPACGCYLHVNPLLYDKISDTDVRKQWWLSEELTSDMLQNITWNGATGDEIPGLAIDNVKEPMDAYTNLKFGCYAGTGTTSNQGDFPLMRIEEMYLIRAEAKENVSAGSGMTELISFIQQNRDPSYTGAADGRTNLDEIWFQRRIELWGEGFAMGDIMRLGKPVVRVHDLETGIYPSAFSFNINSGDAWLLMRFCTQEKNMNPAIIDNSGSTTPIAGDGLDLRDGVTD